jgi:hypothetical protein
MYHPTLSSEFDGATTAPKTLQQASSSQVILNQLSTGKWNTKKEATPTKTADDDNNDEKQQIWTATERRPTTQQEDNEAEAGVST